jgi:hypothetical protein
MTIRENVNAILHYKNYDYMPVVHFGYWSELLAEWHEQGHISREEAHGYGDGNAVDRSIADKLGFDFCWTAQIGTHGELLPGFEHKVLEKKPDGSVIYQNGHGLIEMSKPGLTSIPVTVGTLLEDRTAWETLYKPKLQPDSRRYNIEHMKAYAAVQHDDQSRPFGIHVGSLYGSIRNMLGVEAISYLYADDEELYAEIIDAVGNIAYSNLTVMLDSGLRPDFAHYWEDICFKNGPLVSPEIFAKYVGPQYKRMTDLLLQHGVDIVSLDCDGCIDKLIPIWLENGVNTMFPIEVGTWGSEIGSWRVKYGRDLRGVGGMDKRVFAMDYAAIDKEIERLLPLVELGGYIPCPDHRIAPNAKWENVQYYCDRFRKVFNK